MNPKCLPGFLAAGLSVVLLVGCGGSDSSTTGTRPSSDPPAVGFRDTSGQTNIPAFGTEAPVAERRRAQESLDAYLTARERDAWGRACHYLTVPTRSQLLELIAKSTVENKTCAEALRLSSKVALFGRRPYHGPATIAALRIKEGPGGGFALFHGNDGTDYWIAMKRQGETWRITSTVPEPLR